MNRLILVLWLFLGSQVLAGADLNMDKFSLFLSENINSESSALNVGPSTEDSDEANYFRRFMVRLKAKFGIEVPWIASFTVNPEVEMVFIREYPDGWETYKP